MRRSWQNNETIENNNQIIKPIQIMTLIKNYKIMQNDNNDKQWPDNDQIMNIIK